MRHSSGFPFLVFLTKDKGRNRTFRFLVPQVLTGSRIVLAAGAILSALVNERDAAAKFIVLGVVTDILDGPVAAKLGVQTNFGSLFDYFADYLCYIIAPVLLSCTLLLSGGMGYGGLLLTVPLMTGAIRYSRNANLLKVESFGRVGFPGLLTVCYALVVAGVVLTKFDAMLGTANLRTLLCTATPTMSVLMISRIRYPKLTVSKRVGVTVVVFLLFLPFVLTELMAGVMLLMVALYTVVSPILLLSSSKIANRQIQAGANTSTPEQKQSDVPVFGKIA